MSPQQAAEQQAEAERMQEVMLLLTNLFERERTTIEAIMRCFYDVGTVNLVNQRVKIRPLRPLVRPLLKVSKPLIIPIGYRWVNKKCPAIVTRWLQKKVKTLTSSRPPKEPTQAVLVPPVAEAEPSTVTPLPVLYQGEIRRLKSQVRWTAAALAGVSATLAITLIRVDLNPVELFWQSSTPHPLLVKDRVQRSDRP
jgi:hypothetical protein